MKLDDSKLDDLMEQKPSILESVFGRGKKDYNTTVDSVTKCVGVVFYQGIYFPKTEHEEVRKKHRYSREKKPGYTYKKNLEL